MKPSTMICGLGIFALSACSHPQARISNPEEQTIQALSHKRIVMLGDFAHEYPLSYHTLTSTLSAWLTMLEKGESDQTRVTLFLEEDSQISGLVREYLKNGDLDPLLEFLLPSISIERLEFYADLREITARIDSINRVLPSSKQIVFDIQGPEAMNVFDPKMVDASERAARLYYVNQRDSLSAINVTSYLRARPNQKALMFFGTGHLIRNTVEKGFAGSLTPEEDTGHFLAYYLKREFGDDSVYCIAQVDRRHSPLRTDEFDGPDVMFLSHDVPWKSSPSNDESLVPANFDAFIIRNQFHIPSHPLSHVFSSRIISASIKRSEFLEPHRSGAMGGRFYKEALSTLAFLSDTNFSTPAEWKSWYAVHRFEGLDRLRSEGVRNRLKNDCFQALGTPGFAGYIDDLINLGFDPRVGSPKMTRQEWDKYFADMWPQIVFLNAIGVYWIGDSNEQCKAKDYLVESSGQDYNNPSLYLKLWRKQFYKVAY